MSKRNAPAAINYDAAVRVGKQIVAKMERDWRQLCELADRIETRYNDHTLARFAADIGVPPLHVCPPNERVPRLEIGPGAEILSTLFRGRTGTPVPPRAVCDHQGQSEHD